MGTSVASIVLLPVALFVSLGCGSSRPATFWTAGEAESIKRVRGTALETTMCTGVGRQKASGYRRFSCVGVVIPESAPYLPVRVRYVLNTRGAYKGARSPYLATSVHFDSFGVP
jgi:hypothetical protein